ncbi:MAG TPA: ABC transporter substrate-binding protein, partial [Thermoplasmataceae archaeon]|nr:ABC transporter substrate-binding protein [Thermoplasmataceae archaeon]
MVSKLTTAVIVIVVVAVVGVGGYEGYLHSKAPASGNTLIIASSATPASIDPAVAFDTNSVFFDDQIYQTLLGYGTTTFNGQTVGSLTPVPELATNWTVYSNGSVLFNLRQNVTFSNGDPFNASD